MGKTCSWVLFSRARSCSTQNRPQPCRPRWTPLPLCRVRRLCGAPMRGGYLSGAIVCSTCAQRAALARPWGPEIPRVSALSSSSATRRRRACSCAALLTAGCMGVAVYIRVKGGEVPGGASLAPKIGPLGMVRSHPHGAIGHAAAVHRPRPPRGWHTGICKDYTRSGRWD
jgi:hypothetical protein